MRKRSTAATYEPLALRAGRSLGAWLRKTLAPPGSLGEARWERFFLPVGDATHLLQGEDELLALLKAAPAGRDSTKLLEESRGLYEEPFERAEGAERRATTLQGAVAIAASFSLAGAALLADSSKIQSDGWRLLLGAAYVCVVVALAASALRAVRATSRVHQWHYPHPEGILKRLSFDDREAELKLAAEYLYCAGRNQPIARYKVAQMRAAAHWFSAALVGLIATAIVFGGYLVADPNDPVEGPALTTPSAKGEPDSTDRAREHAQPEATSSGEQPQTNKTDPGAD